MMEVLALAAFVMLMIVTPVVRKRYVAFSGVCNHDQGVTIDVITPEEGPSWLRESCVLCRRKRPVTQVEIDVMIKGAEAGFADYFIRNLNPDRLREFRRVAPSRSAGWR